MSKILFGLRIKPTNNFLGTDGSGSAISIYEDGRVRCDSFVFEYDFPVSGFDVKKDSKIAEDIQNALKKYAKDIEAFPSDIQNETWDGSWFVFTFGDKTVTIDNPFRYGESDVTAISHHSQYEDINANLPYYNNTLLDILDEISAILDHYGLPFLRYG